MKRVERNGCFESNSSSEHVFVVTKLDEHLTPEEIRKNALVHNGKLDLRYTEISDGYGRGPFQVLDSYEGKLAYAICVYCGGKENDPDFNQELNKILDVVQKDLPEVKGFEFVTIKERPYLDKDGNVVNPYEVDFVPDKDDTYKYMYQDTKGRWREVKKADYYVDVPQIGWIDHQSVGLFESFLDKRKLSLREFLTNKRYVILVDGDEEFMTGKMLRCGIIDRNNLEEMYGI